MDAILNALADFITKSKFDVLVFLTGVGFFLLPLVWKGFLLIVLRYRSKGSRIEELDRLIPDWPRPTRLLLHGLGVAFMIFPLVLALLPSPIDPICDGSCTPSPRPWARITQPTDGQRVPVNNPVLVEYNNLPAGHYLWVVVRIPRVQPVWWLYPQLLDGKIPTRTGPSGLLKTNAAFGGGREDSGIPFNLVVLLLNEQAQQAFANYANACGSVPQSCVGMPLPEGEIEILDFNTVVRE